MASPAAGVGTESSMEGLSFQEPPASLETKAKPTTGSEKNTTQPDPPEDTNSGHSVISHPCVKCSGPSSLRCQACSYDEEKKTDNSTWYCSQECQKADWPNHKVRCNHIKAVNRLYRTAHLAEAAFCDFRKSMFDLPIARVNKTNNKLTIYGGLHDERLLREFPEEMFKEERDRKAALTIMACEDAVGRMYHLMSEALEGLLHFIKLEIRLPGPGIYNKIEEVQVKPKLHKRICPAVLIHPGGLKEKEDRINTVLRVTLKDGSTHIIDICEAQYGWNKLVYTWNDYLAKKVENGRVIAQNPHGKLSKTLENWMAAGLPEAQANFYNNSQAQNHLNTALDHWLKQQGNSLAKMMSLEKVKYKEKSAELLGHLSTSLAGFIKRASKTNELFVEVRTGRDGPGRSAQLKRGDGSVFNMAYL